MKKSKEVQEKKEIQEKRVNSKLTVEKAIRLSMRQFAKDLEYLKDK
jgi:hypothetical protein